MAAPDQSSPEAEGKHHTYVTDRIPWFVHVLWVLFWILAISYILVFLVPAMREEVLTPP